MRVHEWIPPIRALLLRDNYTYLLAFATPAAAFRSHPASSPPNVITPVSHPVNQPLSMPNVLLSSAQPPVTEPVPPLSEAEYPLRTTEDPSPSTSWLRTSFLIKYASFLVNVGFVFTSDARNQKIRNCLANPSYLTLGSNRCNASIPLVLLVGIENDTRYPADKYCFPPPFFVFGLLVRDGH